MRPPLHSRMELSLHPRRVLACRSCWTVEGSEPHSRVHAQCALGGAYTEGGAGLRIRDWGCGGGSLVWDHKHPGTLSTEVGKARL